MKCSTLYLAPYLDFTHNYSGIQISVAFHISLISHEILPHIVFCMNLIFYLHLGDKVFTEGPFL